MKTISIEAETPHEPGSLFDTAEVYGPFRSTTVVSRTRTLNRARSMPSRRNERAAT
jgi:hypothetical protein